MRDGNRTYSENFTAFLSAVNLEVLVEDFWTTGAAAVLAESLTSARAEGSLTAGLSELYAGLVLQQRSN